MVGLQRLFLVARTGCCDAMSRERAEEGVGENTAENSRIHRGAVNPVQQGKVGPDEQ